MVTLPTIPDRSVIEYKSTLTYTDLSSPTTTFLYTIVGIPANFIVCGTAIQVLTQFGGSSLSSLTCSLGAFVPNTILNDLTFYSMGIELTQLPSSQSFQISGPANNNLSNLSNPFSYPTALYYNGAHDVSAYFTAVGTTLNNLTAGVVQIIVNIRPC